MTVIIVALWFLLRLLLVMLFPFLTLPVSIRAGLPGVLMSLCEKSGTDFVPISPRDISLGMDCYLFLKIRQRRLILPRESTDNIYLPGGLQTANFQSFRCHSNVMEELRSERGPSLSGLGYCPSKVLGNKRCEMGNFPL